MSKNDIVSARLDLIAAKARILADQYKNNQLWDGELKNGLAEIEREVAAIKGGRSDGWATTSSGWVENR